MKPTPDETACTWVRDRLPLMATEPDEDAPAPGEDPAEVRDERIAVAAHLDGCEACRDRRDALARALDALSAAACESPVDPHAPSLWPALRARMDARVESRPRRQPPRARRPLGRATARLAAARDEIPLRAAWLRDGLREEAPERLRAWLDADRAAASCDRLLRPLASPVGAAAAAALLAAFVGLPLIERVRDDAEARIAAAASPIPAWDPVPLVVTASRPDAVLPPPADDEAGLQEPAEVDERSLAANTEPPLRDPEGRGLDLPRPSSPALAPAPAVRFDLERGVPMPPDARVAKPAY